MIRVLIGTKAQYIKTAPFLRLLDQKRLPYRLIDSGQHGEWSQELRKELGIREPDVFIGGKKDITSISAAIVWSLRILRLLLNRRRLIRDIFGPEPGVCVVHGDTPSTLLGALLARRAGLDVAQLEAGVRSFNLLNPFPEEIVRILTMRLARFLFAESQAAYDQIKTMKIRGEAVLLPSNTIVESLNHSLNRWEYVPATGPAIATLHRLENLKSRQRIRGFCEVLRMAAQHHPVHFILHPPTRRVFEKEGLLDELARYGVAIFDLLPHHEFVRRIATAPFVITDGGSIQEECVLLGVPVLLWRGATERPENLQQNAVLSNYDLETAKSFLRGYEQWRSPLSDLSLSPSSVVLDVLLDYLRSLN